MEVPAVARSALSDTKLQEFSLLAFQVALVHLDTTKRWDGAKVRPRRSHEEPRWGQVQPIRASMVPRWSQDQAKKPPREAKRAKMEPK